jgi:hypothetical protein
MLEKLSKDQLNGIFIRSAGTIRSQSARITELEDELSRRDRVNQATKIASMAVERGVMEEDEAGEYAQGLATSAQDLVFVEDFVSRAAVGVPLGNTLEKVASEGEDGDESSDPLTSFLLTSDYAR